MAARHVLVWFDDHDRSMLLLLLLLLFARASNVYLCAGRRVRPTCWRIYLSFLGVLMLVRRSSGLTCGENCAIF